MLFWEGNTIVDKVDQLIMWQKIISPGNSIDPRCFCFLALATLPLIAHTLITE